VTAAHAVIVILTIKVAMLGGPILLDGQAPPPGALPWGAARTAGFGPQTAAPGATTPAGQLVAHPSPELWTLADPTQTAVDQALGKTPRAAAILCNAAPERVPMAETQIRMAFPAPGDRRLAYLVETPPDTFTRKPLPDQPGSQIVVSLCTISEAKENGQQAGIVLGLSAQDLVGANYDSALGAYLSRPQPRAREANCTPTLGIGERLLVVWAKPDPNRLGSQTVNLNDLPSFLQFGEAAAGPQPTPPGMQPRQPTAPQTGMPLGDDAPLVMVVEARRLDTGDPRQLVGLAGPGVLETIPKAVAPGPFTARDITCDQAIRTLFGTASLKTGPGGAANDSHLAAHLDNVAPAEALLALAAAFDLELTGDGEAYAMRPQPPEALRARQGLALAVDPQKQARLAKEQAARAAAERRAAQWNPGGAMPTGPAGFAPVWIRNQFTVTGAVKMHGIQPIRPDMTALQALDHLGGLQSDADLTRVLLIHESGDWEELDLIKLKATPTQAPKLKPGDILVVGRKG
jgi:hypothetical protein